MGPRNSRLWVAAALLCLWLLSGATPASASESGVQPTSPDPTRKGDAGFEFRGRLASIDNPYCPIVTYVLRDFPEQASSTQDANDRPVIVIDASALRTDRAYGHFLMAHECCHHSLGHTRRASQRLGQLGPQPFYYLKPLLKGMELEADGCAVRMLKRSNAFDAIDSARRKMLEFGAEQTGAYYPTGIERADNISQIAAEE